jgi:hypothetical protein
MPELRRGPERGGGNDGPAKKDAGEAVQHYQGCELYKHATQAVFGE